MGVSRVVTGVTAEEPRTLEEIIQKIMAARHDLTREEILRKIYHKKHSGERAVSDELAAVTVALELGVRE